MESLSPTSTATPDVSYRFVLPSFEGPLDLLLHLIRINEVDLKDIPVIEIARQYDEMLELMHELNLDVAGEFLVMAATLVYIKSKLLLPVERERIEQGLEADPRADLSRALIEHERYRRAAERLREQEQMAALSFGRASGEESEEQGLLEVSVFDLLTAFKRVAEVAGKRQALRVQRLKISLEHVMAGILERLEAVDQIPFAEVIREDPRLEARIVVFLAILELIRTGAIRAYQVRPFDEIQLRRGEIQ